MRRSAWNPKSVPFGRGETIGAVGCALFVLSAVHSARLQCAPAEPAAHGPVAHVRRTPFAAALREAVVCQWGAQRDVNEERDAWEAWDPEATPRGEPENWRLQLMAQDRTGSLRQAREAVLRAAALARTPAEVYEAALQRARIECNSGHHEVEYHLARRLLALQPRNRLSWMVLRRAARCTGRRSSEREALAWLRAAEGQEDQIEPGCSAHSQRDEP